MRQPKTTPFSIVGGVAEFYRFGHELIPALPALDRRVRFPCRLAQPDRGCRGQSGLARCGSTSERTPPPTWPRPAQPVSGGEQRHGNFLRGEKAWTQTAFPGLADTGPT
jgi:hypothetical protein